VRETHNLDVIALAKTACWVQVAKMTDGPRVSLQAELKVRMLVPLVFSSFVAEVYRRPEINSFT